MLSLSQYTQKLEQQYQRHFAGHPRFSRDASLLRRMVTDARARLATEDAQTSDRASLDQLEHQVGFFESEAEQIENIQSSSPEDFLAHEYRSWVDLIFDRYRRNFAGQNRVERDLHLLNGLKTELQKIGERISKLSHHRSSEVIDDAQSACESHLTLFKNEFIEISKLRTAGEAGQQTSILANDANRLFEHWGDYFGGKSRVSRRIDRLQLMIDHLRWLQEKMSALEGSADPERLNQKNREICLKRAEFYTQELGHIKEVRGQTEFDDLVLSLGESANLAFADYRESFAGKDRKEVPLNKLNLICEELFDLAVQMNELDLVRSHEANQQNLATVLDQLRLFQREYDTIRKTQRDV